MITYLGECMALSVKVAVGTFLWFGLIIGLVALIAIIAALVMKKNKSQPEKIPPGPEDPPKAAKAVTLHVVGKEKENGGTDNGL